MSPGQQFGSGQVTGETGSVTRFLTINMHSYHRPHCSKRRRLRL